MTLSFIIRPASAVKVACKVSGAWAYTYTTARGAFACECYAPKAKTQATTHVFKVEADRNEHVRKFFVAYTSRMVNRKASIAARFAPHKLEIGHVFVTSWGYDQTNVEFYEVTKLIGKNTVELREIPATATHDGGGCSSGRKLPILGEFKGEAFVRRVSMAGGSPSVRIDSSATGRLWDGKPQYYSWGH